MALSSQESHCVNLVCQYLAKELEGTWTVESCLDDLYPEEPTPGVLVTNGRASAAIEVKRLTGDSIYQAYKQSLLSNQKFLAPSCGGYYTVSPPDDFRLPMALDLRRRVKREIECVAPILKPDETGVLRFPRKGRISLISESGPPYVTCSHYGPYSELLRPLMERVDGKLMLIDDKGFSHSFITEEGRNGFYDAVVGACGRRCGRRLG